MVAPSVLHGTTEKSTATAVPVEREMQPRFDPGHKRYRTLGCFHVVEASKIIALLHSVWCIILVISVVAVVACGIHQGNEDRRHSWYMTDDMVRVDQNGDQIQPDHQYRRYYYGGQDHIGKYYPLIAGFLGIFAMLNIVLVTLFWYGLLRERRGFMLPYMFYQGFDILLVLIGCFMGYGHSRHSDYHGAQVTTAFFWAAFLIFLLATNMRTFGYLRDKQRAMATNPALPIPGTPTVYTAPHAQWESVNLNN
jgi:hypothetical protein